MHPILTKAHVSDTPHKVQSEQISLDVLVNNFLSMNTTAMSTVNYSNMLINWEALPSTPTGLTLTATACTYNSSAIAARASLESTYGLTIIDAGLV